MKVVVIALLGISLSGCGFGQFAEEGKIQEAVRVSLKDPDSAKFGKLTQVNKSRACLTVNAKNALGGYTGDQVAYLAKSENKWVVLQIEGDLGHEECIDIMSKV